MPGCVFRVSGGEFDAESFLANSPFKPCNVFRKGDRRGVASTWSESGFTVEVSGASGGELDVQIEDAIEFLRKNSGEVIRLKCCQGLSDMRLDFGVSRKDVFLQSSHLPFELLALAGNLNVGIDISIYGNDE